MIYLRFICWIGCKKIIKNLEQGAQNWNLTFMPLNCSFLVKYLRKRRQNIRYHNLKIGLRFRQWRFYSAISKHIKWCNSSGKTESKLTLKWKGKKNCLELEMIEVLNKTESAPNLFIKVALCSRRFWRFGNIGLLDEGL